MSKFEVRENVDLKPCPFCGGKAFITGLFIPTEDDEVNMYEVGCRNCDVSFRQMWQYERIVELWNTRFYKGGDSN